ncbi:MAG: cobalt-precorrin-5B (C(1))-methyltransferase [Egibacteraceae bacterium]
MSSDLHEPDLPRTAKMRTGPLRSGWTTGTCSAAAAKAAAILLAGDPPPSGVEVALPDSSGALPRTPSPGRRVTFPVARTAQGDGWAEAVVIKDAGDDPDVTHGAHLTVRLRTTDEPGVAYRAGEGVGTVTKPGLGLEVGGPAINPVPRAQIAAAIGEVLDLDRQGVVCEIRVPGGERMARKTTNARLGILGGISILGTSGIVRPFSTASWRASVVQAIDVLAAQGLDTVVLSTGGRTERAAMRLLPDLPEVCFVEVGDFTGAALRQAVGDGLRRCVFVGMVGKLAKLAAGVMMTHYTRSKVDLGLLAELVAQAGGGTEAVAAVTGANTARHAYELMVAHGVDRAPSLLCDRVATNLERFAGCALHADVVMIDFDTLEPVGASRRFAP